MIILCHLVVSIYITRSLVDLASWNSGMMEHWNNGFLIGLESYLI